MASDDSDDNEPRAGELMRDPRKMETLDPITIERLAQWFGGGVALAYDDEFANVDPGQENRDRAAAQVDPDLLAKVTHEPLVSEPEAPKRIVDPNIAKFRSDGWLAPEPEQEPRYYQRGGDIDDAIRDHNTPQAKLRDLHRPVWEFQAIPERVVERRAGWDDTREQALEFARKQAQPIRISQVATASRLGGRAYERGNQDLEQAWDEQKSRARPDEVPDA